MQEGDYVERDEGDCGATEVCLGFISLIISLDSLDSLDSIDAFIN